MHYNNAPITEAALDIFVRLPAEITLDALQGAQAGEEEKYPTVKKPHKAEVTLSPSPEHGIAVQAVENTRLGFAFFAADGKQVFQARLDGFTHNRLAPYQDWGTFRSEAARLWDHYKSVASPTAIELIGLHYANVIDLPLKQDFSDFFGAYIFLAPTLPQVIEGFTLAVQLPFDEFGARLALVQTYAPQRKPDTVAVVLDIRVFRQIGESTAEYDDAQLWEAFEQLRQAKNAAFEGCITDRVREMIR